LTQNFSLHLQPVAQTTNPHPAPGLFTCPRMRLSFVGRAQTADRFFFQDPPGQVSRSDGIEIPEMGKHRDEVEEPNLRIGQRAVRGISRARPD
jgi:hypothetical protein